MKFKTAVIGGLIAILLVGTTTAIILIQETKQQTKIAFEMLEETKKQTENILNIEEEIRKQTESVLNAEEESKKQTEIAQKSAELLFIQVRTTTDKRAQEIIDEESDETDISYFNNFVRAVSETSQIGKALNQELWESLNKN